jgi:hypothetical protein
MARHMIVKGQLIDLPLADNLSPIYRITELLGRPDSKIIYIPDPITDLATR